MRTHDDLRVVYDGDGPLLEDGTPNFFRWAIETRGLPWSFEQYARTGSWDCAAPGFSHEQRDQLYAEYWQSDYYQADRLTAGAVEANRKLAKAHRYLVTARMNGMAVHTETLLKKHVGTFAGYHFGVLGKHTIIGALKAHFFIEDNIREARLAARNTRATCILFPIRGVPRCISEPRIITPDADWVNDPDIDDKDWEKLCQSAWQQIVSIISR